MLTQCKKNGGDNSMTVNDHLVEVRHVTAHSALEDGMGYQYMTTLDFGDDAIAVAPWILKLAAESVIIKWRVKFNVRNHENPETLNNRTFMVSEIVSGRSKKSQVEKVENLALKMTDAQKQELIDSLMAQIKK